ADQSKRSENVESNSEPPLEFKYYDRDEVDKQVQLWIDEDKKHPWVNPPPKVKVTTKKGICHMHTELTIGRIPESVYLLFANPLNNQYFQEFDGKNFWFSFYTNESKPRKLLRKDGPRRIAEVEKIVSWNFLWFSRTLPINLIVEDNQKDLTGSYKKKKVKFMKVFEGRWKVEPLFIDSERLCKQIEPKSREEYRKCSGGRGRIASKVTIDQYFEPSSPLNLPPFSWFIRRITIKTNKNLINMLK
ncbi:hypothetical protein CARUB_v10012439mg, partial [Capsella rubella]